MQGVNEYFKDFKTKEEKHGETTKSSTESRHLSTLPPIDQIIAESHKVKINKEWMDDLKQEFKRTQKTKKQNQKQRVIKLAKIKKKAMKEIEDQQREQEQQMSL